MIRRSKFFVLLLPCLLLLSCATDPERRKAGSGLAGSRPNIVVVLTDDQGYGELSCHGNPILQTPNLDRLHAASLRFTRFHVSPTCAPTRAALLTGQHEFRSGVTHTIFERERLSLKAQTLGNILQNAGYTTGIFGKWHLGDEDDYLPNKRGFHEVFIHGGGGIGQTYPGSCGDAPGNSYFDPAIWHNDRFVKTRGYCTDLFFDTAAHWITERGKTGSPFLAWISPNVPHDPFITPGPDWEAPFRDKGLGTNTVRYYAMISHLDAAVGRLLDTLDRTGLTTNTLVIFMTDNGHSVPRIYNAGMRAMKGTPYEGGTRVPSFWRWPGHIPGNVDIPALTAHIDLLPTLAALAGARAPKDIDGRSLLPLLENPGAYWPERMLFTHVGRWELGKSAEAKFKNCAVQNSRFKLVNNSELYDLENDFGETNNIIASHPEVVSRFQKAYDQWWTSIFPAALESELAEGPPVNPFKQRYWSQFGKPPGTQTWEWKMNPALKFDPQRPPL